MKPTKIKPNILPIVYLCFCACSGNQSNYGPGKDAVPPITEIEVDPTTFCETSADCPEANQDCYANLCLAACTQSSDCEAAEQCDPDRAELLSACGSDSDCTHLGASCIDNRCRHICSQDADCPLSQDICEQGLCSRSHCILHTWVGSLEFNELQVLNQDSQKESHDTLVSAAFRDFTYYAVQDAERIILPDYPACTVYTAKPVANGEPGKLTISQLHISGLVEPDLTLEPNQNGDIPTTLLDQRGFTQQDIQIVAQAGQQTDSFPAFSSFITPPLAPKLTRLDTHHPVDLRSSPEIEISVERIKPMLVCWEPSGADWVEIKIAPGTGSQTPWGKLRCITYDDGCLEIPAAALTVLAMDTATNFVLRIENHNVRLEQINQDEQLKAVVQIDASSVLQGFILPSAQRD